MKKIFTLLMTVILSQTLMLMVLAGSDEDLDGAINYYLDLDEKDEDY